MARKRQGERDRQIAETYLGGLGIKAVAEQFDVNPSTVLYILRRDGVPRRRPGRPRKPLESTA